MASGWAGHTPSPLAALWISCCSRDCRRRRYQSFFVRGLLTSPSPGQLLCSPPCASSLSPGDALGLFSLHACSPTAAASPFGGPERQWSGGAPPPAPRFCEANSKIWLFMRAGQGLGPLLAAELLGCASCDWLRGLELPAPESLQWAAGQQAVPAPALLCCGAGGVLDS